MLDGGDFECPFVLKLELGELDIVVEYLGKFLLNGRCLRALPGIKGGGQD